MVIGVQRNGLCVVFDLLQSSKEFIRCLGNIGHTSRFENILVVKHTVGVAGGRDTVDRAIISTFVDELVFLAQILNRSQWAKELRELIRRNSRRNIQNIAVIG